MKPEFDRYKPHIESYLSQKGIDTRQNFQCLNKDHHDGGDPSSWSMRLYGENVKCFGCGVNWDIYDLIGNDLGITDKLEQYNTVSRLYGGQAVERSEKKSRFEPDTAALAEITDYIRKIRANYTKNIGDFCTFRGFSDDYGSRFAWWPGNKKAIESGISPETLIKAGFLNPENHEKSSYNAYGVIVKLGKGFKLFRKGKPEESGKIPTVKRGSIGCRTFPYPELPKGDKIILCEGELDAISARYAGIAEVCAIGGTNGLGTDDIKQLLPYKCIVLAMDADTGGGQAMGILPFVNKSGKLEKRKAIPQILREVGFTGNILIADLSGHGEKDIDDFVKHGKINELKTALENAKEYKGCENEQKRTEKMDKKPEQNSGENLSDGNGTSMFGIEKNVSENEGKLNSGPKQEIQRNSGKPDFQNADGLEKTRGNNGKHGNAINQPFQFLGFDESGYYFLPVKQQVAIRLPRGQQSMKSMLFEIAPPEFYLKYFHTVNKDGDAIIDYTTAIQWLRTESVKKGMFDDEQLLGVGAHDDDGNIVINTGRSVIDTTGTVSQYEQYKGKLTFLRSKVELVATGSPWTQADGTNFFKQLCTFGFETQLCYFIIAGFCAISPFSSFLFRRPHIWITARQGTGKSFLITDLMNPIIGESKLFIETGTTEAGIRQGLHRDSRPVILDEFELNEKYDSQKITSIQALARSAYGGSQIIKGSSNHKAVNFTTKMMFCFASVNVNISNAADRARIAVCRMTESRGKMERIKNPDGLRARIFSRIKEIKPAIEKMSEFMNGKGFIYRTSDTYAPFYVGSWLALSDSPFFEVNNEYDQRLYDAMVKSLEDIKIEDERRPDEERIMEAIFQYQIINGTEKTTIGELVMQSYTGSSTEISAGNTIQAYGIRRHYDTNYNEILSIRVDNMQIKKMLEGTPFSSAYKEVLKRNSAYIGTKTVRISGSCSNCLVFDWKLIKELYFSENTDTVPF